MSQIGDKMHYTKAQREDREMNGGVCRTVLCKVVFHVGQIRVHAMDWLPFTSWGSTEASIPTLLRQDCLSHFQWIYFVCSDPKALSPGSLTTVVPVLYMGKIYCILLVQFSTSSFNHIISCPDIFAGETPVKTSSHQAWPSEATHHSQAKTQPSRQISGQETLACLGESDEAW